MQLSERQNEDCESSSWDFSGLKALFLNSTLKRLPEQSHTQGLIDIAQAIMRKNAIDVEVIHPEDHNLALGMYPDMTEHGWQRDDWPAIYDKAMAADILVPTTRIWLGEKSSVCTPDGRTIVFVLW